MEADSKIIVNNAFSINWNTEGGSKNLQRQNENHCSDPKMTHATLVPQPFEKRDKKLDHNTIRKKFVTTTGSAKSSSTTSIASPTSSPGWLTRQDITKASLRNSTYKIWLHYRTSWEEYCAVKSIIFDSPAFEHFLTFFREFFTKEYRTLFWSL